MNAAANGSRSPGPFFEIAADWLPAGQQMVDADLPGHLLAGVTLDLVRISPGGKWHPVPASAQVAPCARVRRAAATGRELTRRQAGLLTGLELCRACTAQIQLTGRAGTYLDIARHIIAARAWTQAFEQAAPEADWPACLRWTARTPFTSENVPGLIDALGGDPGWEPTRSAATTAWQQLRDRAGAAQERARLAAGPPGLRAHTAAACALVAAQQDTVRENELIGPSPPNRTGGTRQRRTGAGAPRPGPGPRRSASTLTSTQQEPRWPTPSSSSTPPRKFATSRCCRPRPPAPAVSSAPRPNGRRPNTRPCATP